MGQCSALIGGRIADTHGRKASSPSRRCVSTALISIFFITLLWQMYAMLMVVSSATSPPAISAIQLKRREKDRASSPVCRGVNAHINWVLYCGRIQRKPISPGFGDSPSWRRPHVPAPFTARRRTQGFYTLRRGNTGQVWYTKPKMEFPKR